MRYSPSTNGFYPEEINYGDNLPKDLIVISDELYQNLLTGQSEGKVITANGKKLPYLSDMPPPTKEEAIALAIGTKASLLSEATVAISPLQDSIDLDMATDEEERKLAAWKKYRVLVNRVDTSLAPDIEWPEKP